MKLNKTLGRVATTLVAGAMLTALAMPAYAAENKLTTTEDTVSFTKAITKDDAAGVPTGQFVFTISDGTNGDASKQIVDEDGNTEGVQIVSNAGTVEIGFTMTGFSEPGTYNYILQESSTDIPGMSVDSTQYNLNVVVVNADSENPDGKTFVINSAELKASGATGKTDTITDTYHTYSLTLDKTLAGTFADKNDSFVFTIAFDSNDTHATSFKLGNDVVSFGEDGTATREVTLKDGESIVADGLPEGTTYTITELTEKGDAVNYVTTTSGNGVDTGSEEKVVVGDMMVDVEGGSQVASDVEVHYLNTWNGSPATGIVMNVAPYVLLVLVAAAGCFVFLRKRRED